MPEGVGRRAVWTRALLLVACAAALQTACKRDGASAGSERANVPLPSVANWQTIGDSLRQMMSEDQRGREDLARAVAANDTVTLFRMMRADSLRARWLQRIVERYGWPGIGQVGDSAAGSAWLILQHSPILEFQRATLPLLETAAGRGDVKRSEVAMLTDRVRVHSGQPQLYGSSFSVVNGRLVADSVEDLPGLEARRAKVGLPPMAVYTKGMAAAYQMPVVWPPAH